uniref:Uncharacterized protein n=1 Tax=Ficedula albicollis TaxID=59894 RepID=A0A803V8J1_FICAL
IFRNWRLVNLWSYKTLQGSGKREDFFALLHITKREKCNYVSQCFPWLIRARKSAISQKFKNCQTLCYLFLFLILLKSLTSKFVS